MIAEIIKILQDGEYYGAGQYTEIAKGKREMISTWKGFKRKIKRKVWQSRKQ
tara:strand:+ start:228 stop:383 length:156 start_codon:yes stop_codon:yes gene_type:complete